VSERACGTCLLRDPPGGTGWALCLARDNGGRIRGLPVLPASGNACLYWRENVPAPRALSGDEEGC
jgi:hypothetical protein